MTIRPRETALLLTVLTLLSGKNVSALPYMLITTSDQKCVSVDVPRGTNILVKYDSPDATVPPHDEENRSNPRRRLTELDQPGYDGEKKEESGNKAWGGSFEELEKALEEKKNLVAMDAEDKKKTEELELDVEAAKKTLAEPAKTSEISSEEKKHMEALVGNAAAEAEKIRNINVEMKKRAAEEKKAYHKRDPLHELGEQTELETIEKELKDQLEKIKDFGQFKVPPHPGMDRKRVENTDSNPSEHREKMDSMQIRTDNMNERISTTGHRYISIRETGIPLTEFFHLPRPVSKENNGPKQISDTFMDGKQGATQEFLPNHSGVVEICVRIPGATVKNPIRIHLEVSDLKKPRPKAPKQNEIKDYLDEVEEKLWDLNKELENILLEADYAKDQEVVFHRHSVEMNSAATWWPMIQVSILLLTGLVYANHLVSFFKRHNIV